jgi:hypothetical protein
MAQPTRYDHTTDFSQEEQSQVSGRSTVRTPQLDAEFDAIELTLTGLCDNIALIQRDDGKLVDALVTLSSLSSQVLALMVATGEIRGDWAPTTAYAYKDVVESGGNSYICVVAHTSGADFATDKAAGKWIFLSATASATGTSFDPTANVSSTNVQAAIEELDNELRPNLNVVTYIPQGAL